MNKQSLEDQKVWMILNEIPDPEIPVITIVDLGIVRNVVVNEKNVEVTITPTYSGCPAMKQMEDDIVSLLKKNGYNNIKIVTTYTPAWTTDWLNKEAKEKLIKYGIAPPEHSSLDKNALIGKQKTIKCPRCKSTKTRLVSQFGSTACKALYQCEDCLEPFDYFKCI